MKRPNSHAPSALAWYILWSAMFLMAALKAVDVHPIFSGNLDFGLSALLALAAGVRILCGIESLQPRESGLAAVLLLLFCNAQLMEFAVSKRPPSPYQGDDFAAYYIAGRVLSEKPISESLYSFPRLPDGSMNLNAEAPVSSPWHTAATRYKVRFAAP
jgi:hypothetical protein